LSFLPKYFEAEDQGELSLSVGDCGCSPGLSNRLVRRRVQREGRLVSIIVCGAKAADSSKKAAGWKLQKGGRSVIASFRHLCIAHAWASVVLDNLFTSLNEMRNMDESRHW
jgi:hypothetical protein